MWALPSQNKVQKESLGSPVYRHWLMDVKDPMLSFVKSGRDIADTLYKAQIPARPNLQRALHQQHTQPMMLPRSLLLRTNKECVCVCVCWHLAYFKLRL